MEDLHYERLLFVYTFLFSPSTGKIRHMPMLAFSGPAEQDR